MTATLAASGCGGSGDDPELPPLKAGDRDPANFMIVLDASSGMSGDDTLENVRKALSSFVRDLPPGDSVGLSTYSNALHPLVPIATVRGNRERLAQSLEGLEAGGGGRLYDATLESYGILRELAGSGRVDGLLLIVHSPESGSDATAAEVRKLLSAQRGSLAQVQVITVAYDADRRVRDTLAAVARASAGRAYTSDANGLERALRRAWSGL